MPVGKRMGGVAAVFSGLHRVRVWRPLSPVCALGTSPKRGSASRHCLNRRLRLKSTCHCEERGTSDVAIRIPLGQTEYQLRRKGERIPTSGFALLGMTEVGVSGLRRFLHGSLRKKYKSARRDKSTPLAPLLGELSSASETEGSPGLWECRWGKEWAVVRPVFSGLHRVPPRRPLRRFAALSKTARRLTATTVIPRPLRTLVVGIRIHQGQTDYQLRRKRERIATSLRSSQ